MRTITLAEAGMESTKDKVYTYQAWNTPIIGSGSEYVQGSPDYSPNPKLWRQTGIATHKFTFDPKPMDAVKWLDLATVDLKKETVITEKLRTLSHIHPTKKYTFAANEYLVHRVWDTGLVKKTYKGKGVIPNTEIIYRQHHDTTIQVSRYHVLRAIAACEVFSKDAHNIIRMSVNGDMKFSGQNAEYGDTTVVIANGDNWSDVKAPNSTRELETMAYKRSKLFGRDYTDAVYLKDGDDVEIAFNYKYLKNIVLGMPDVFNIGLASSASPAVFWGEVDGVLRDACLMPMSIGR
jgi:hypothetical protein